jgi:endoglucanase Acf2
VLWQFDFEKETADFEKIEPHALEHVSWVNHIRDGKPICQAEETAVSTLSAIMGRMSAYTGAEVKWDEAMASDMNLMPNNLELKDVDLTQYVVPVPGKA